MLMCVYMYTSPYAILLIHYNYSRYNAGPPFWHPALYPPITLIPDIHAICPLSDWEEVGVNFLYSVKDE